MKKFLHGWSLILTLALLTGLGSCSKDDAETPATVNVGQSMITFKAFDKEAKTITVDASQDWTFEVTGDSQVCEVTREEGSNVLTITPKINYDNVAYTAQIVISAGEGSAKASQTITVTQEANADTYMIFQDSELNTDNPIVTVENDPDGGATLKEIRLVTNNKLSVVYSENQGNPTTQSLEAGTRAAIENCNWITYEVSEEETEEGTMTILTLSCSYNENTKNSRTAFLEIVSGEGTKNKVLKKRLGITQMADTPTIIINAPEEGLVASYDQSKPLTFSVAGNVEFAYDWVQTPSWATLTETTDESSTSNVRNFSLEFSEWTGLSDREATLSFYAVDGGSDVAATHVKVIQTAAPQASISLNMNSVVFNNDEENNTKYVEAECSFSTMDITTKDLETETEANWLTVTYDASAKAISVKVNGKTEKTRSAEIELYCGDSGNEASAILTVIQLGTEATLLLDPENVALDSKGTAQVVSVLTNQTDWTVVEATAEPNFKLTIDQENKTITISAEPLDAGIREHVYTVKAGDLEKQLTVSQRTAYKVGDPYMVNGKPVGIVYQVDEAGMHGKAFSLTTYNINNLMTHKGLKFSGSIPANRADGKANRDIFMAEPDWENQCEVAKWTADLAAKDGVDWYVPAIDELIELVEYMSGGLQFYQVDTYYYGIPFSITINGELTEYPDNLETAHNGWDIIRDLYKTYTNDEQYVVFEPYIFNQDDNGDYIMNPDGSYSITMIDCRQPASDWGVSQAGDDQAYVWFSSTVSVATWGNTQQACTVTFNDNRIQESVIALGSSGGWWDEFGGSIHPICQF